MVIVNPAIGMSNFFSCEGKYVIELICIISILYKIDILNRQLGEKFYTWAKRIQECMKFYYFTRSHIPYFKSYKSINDYIICIKF